MTDGTRDLLKAVGMLLGALFLIFGLSALLEAGRAVGS